MHYRNIARHPAVLLLTVILIASLGAQPWSAHPVGATTTTLFSSDFESGSFSGWSAVRTGGDGSATVQSRVVRSGTYAARLSESSSSGSFAYAREALSSPHMDLTASGDFWIAQEGAA